MNRLFFILLIPLFVLMACNRDKPSKDLLEKDVLVPLLVDMHMTYAIQSSTDFRELSKKVDSVDSYTYILNKYNVSKVVFDSSIAWYSRHPAKFTQIYDEVIMTLTQMQDSLKSGDEE